MESGSRTGQAAAVWLSSALVLLDMILKEHMLRAIAFFLLLME
jgi:hypothetical protein